MTGPAPSRVSLILPVSSRRAVVAATNVVLALLRSARVELDLLRGPADAGTSPQYDPGTPGAILFVATDIQLPADNPAAPSELEANLRGRIERAYARQGISPVEYELQIV